MGKGIYKGKNRHKVKSGSKKISRVDDFTITPEEMLLKIIPRITNFMQGYFGAAFLVVLEHGDKKLYADAMEYVN